MKLGMRILTIFFLLAGMAMLITACGPKQYSLSTSVTPDGAGSVSVESGIYEEGTVLTLHAESLPGYAFDYWSGDITGDSNPATIVMDSDKDIIAHFIAQYSLSTSANPHIGGAISPEGGVYNDDTQLTVTAEPSPGYIFDYWSGDITGDSNPATIVMDSDKDITAYFMAQYALSTSVTPDNTGTVTPSGGVYDDGTSLALTAQPSSGYIFDCWIGDAHGSTNPVTIIMDSDKDITAYFRAQYALSTSVTPDNTGTVTPSSGVYIDGTRITLTAEPVAGYSFDYWSGDVTGEENPVTVVMDGDISVIAHFAVQYSLSTSVTPVGGGEASPVSGMYDKGTEVRLDATAAPGYIFDYWSGDITSSSHMPTIVIDSDKSVTAHFKLYYSESFSMVAGGSGNPLAATYGGSEHPVILIGTDGNEHEWSSLLSSAWLSASEEEVQLVLCVGPEEKKVIQTCLYDGPDITRYQYYINVQLREAKTGRIVAQTKIYGSMPRACQQTEDYWLTELYGSHVDILQLEEWLEDHL
jgi:hypothetical protein